MSGTTTTTTPNLSNSDRLSRMVVTVGRMQDELRQMYAMDPAQTNQAALASLERVRGDVNRLMLASDLKMREEAREREINNLFDPDRPQPSDDYDDGEVDPIIEAALAEAEGRSVLDSVDAGRSHEYSRQPVPLPPSRPRPVASFDYYAPRMPSLLPKAAPKRQGGWSSSSSKPGKKRGAFKGGPRRVREDAYGSYGGNGRREYHEDDGFHEDRRSARSSDRE